MNNFWSHLFHQAFFGGIAASGFGILFNCPPRMIWQCFGTGAVALAVRTTGQAADFNLAEASFFAALAVATAERLLQQFQPTHGSILSLVGCIPMVPGSIAANGLMNFFALLRPHPTGEILAATSGMRNLLEVTFTLAAIGTALAIPRLIYPRKISHLKFMQK
jgi:uncharacterized membrane protein YjjB (DUF3815 family)